MWYVFVPLQRKSSAYVYIQGRYRSRYDLPLGLLDMYSPLRLGLRLAEKRSFPCPQRTKWLEARDQLYEDIMEKAWNKELQIFGQSYEDTDVLDSSLLIMPLVFFSTPVSFWFVYWALGLNNFLHRRTLDLSAR